MGEAFGEQIDRAAGVQALHGGQALLESVELAVELRLFGVDFGLLVGDLLLFFGDLGVQVVDLLLDDGHLLLQQVFLLGGRFALGFGGVDRFLVLRLLLLERVEFLLDLVFLVFQALFVYRPASAGRVACNGQHGGHEQRQRKRQAAPQPCGQNAVCHAFPSPAVRR